uniref:TonB-dependent receptor n=1 Tax=Mucilaginibacter sp. Bleaf8 TaxID=2834430 RepID=UPI0020C1078B|nr:carboxypeptidase-like regulatory domain-containing protein [Mucilaginibacter sp. Bleaf8]
MKKHLYLIILSMLLLQQVVYSQSGNTPDVITQTIKGTVTDKNTKLRIPGVTVRLTSTQPAKAAATGADGVFRITGVPVVGRHSVEISCTGFETLIISDVLVISGKETELNLELNSSSQQLSEVVVRHGVVKRPLNTMAMASGRSFSPEETNRYAGAFFDPARMAQSFAGVVAGGDNNEIIVRGNSPKSLQWRLEGIEIINPNHFSNNGSAGGAISMINSTMLSTSDFYTGAMPAEYNNATAGVFDLKFRKGNTDRREYSFTAGVLGVGATLEGPFSKGSQSSYLISYRYSSLDLLMKMGVDISDGGVPRYQDLSFNFVFPTRKAGTFSLFGIGGSGGLKEKAKHDIQEWDERKDAFEYDGKYTAGSFGLKNIYVANEKLYISHILSYSGDYTTSTSDSLSQTYIPSLVYRGEFNNTTVRYAGMINYRPDNSNTIRAGLNAGLLNYNMRSLSYKQELKALDEVLNQKGSAATFDAYIENKHDFGNSVSLNTGIHTNYFNLSKSFTIEPRVGLNWQFRSDQQLSFAAGTYSRIEPLAYYFAKGTDLSGKRAVN